MDLRIENLSKYFDGKPAVEIPALTIRHREFFTFVGPSGCGKSTTLNLIAGLETPTGGSLHLGERLLNDLPPHKRDVAFVFQSYALYPHRTVSQNLSFPLPLARVPRETIRQRVQEMASLLGLTLLLDKHPRQLSGGERQRVALGRAIIRQPKLFLFDEPLSNLDAPLRAQMRKELKRLHRQLGTTFIYVTHDQEEALSLSDRIAVMRAGHIQQCGSPVEVYEQPANTFVASFFGLPLINFLDGCVETHEKGLRVRVGGNVFSLEDCDPKSVPTGPITVGIRPEHLRLSRVPKPEGWPAEISLVELHGGQAHLELTIGKVQLTAVQPTEAGYRVGDKVWTTVTPGKVYLFDSKTEIRIAP